MKVSIIYCILVEILKLVFLFQDDLSFTLVQNVRQVLEHAFDGGFTPQENSNVISFSKL